MQTFAVILYCAMAFLLIVYLILFWTIGVISGRYFDAKLISKKKKLPIVIRIATSRTAARAACYYACILMNGMKSKYMHTRMKRNFINNFGDTDYRALARKRDWVMAILFWGSALGFLITAITVCVTSAILGVH